MGEVWAKNESMELVLYEKTLYFVQALLEPKLTIHPTLTQIQVPLFNKLAQVLIQTKSSEDVRYKMCFAMLQSADPDLVSQAIRSFT